MTLFPRKILPILNLCREYVFNLNKMISGNQKWVMVNLFVDISAYTPPNKFIFRLKHSFLVIISLVLTLVLANFINNTMVFQDEEVQTLLMIQRIMAIGFLVSGLMAVIFLSFLMPLPNRLKGLNLIEKNVYTTGIRSLVAGAIFIILCLFKFYFLIYLPGAFDVYIELGLVTIYLLQGLFYLGLVICLGIIFDRILSLISYLDLYLNSSNNH